MMTYRQLFQNYSQDLVEPESLAYTFRHKKSWSYTTYILQLDDEVSAHDQAMIIDLADQLRQDVPPQYLIGAVDFRELTLKVDSRALIPRPETEELVDLILVNHGAVPLRVLDLGTGTGAIGLSLKQARPMWSVTLSDISEQALSLAQENADAQGLEVEFVHSNVFEGISGRYDIIVSNPPYIDPADKDEVDRSVLTYEPHQALFAANQGLELYERIIQQSPHHLTDKGALYFEIGYKQGHSVSALLRRVFPERQIEVIKDLYGKDRKVVMR